MHNIQDLRFYKEKENQLINNQNFDLSLKLTSYSDPSLISSISNSSHGYSSSIDQQQFYHKDIEHFDIIDSLDFDDVDDHIINQEILHRQREGHIRELFESETKYSNLLQSITDQYILPLRKALKSPSFNLLNIKKQPCTEKEIAWLFSNIEDLYQLHNNHLTQLNERLSIWGPTQIISDIVQTLFPRLQNQYQNYFDNYDLSLNTLDKLSKYQPFKKFIDNVDKSSSDGISSLLALLRAPVNYLPHYHKLLNTLVDNTSSMHPDYIGLIQCKSKLQSIIDDFQKKFQDMKNVDQVYNILNNMNGHPFTLKPSRRFYLQNNTFSHVSKLSMSEDRICFLFNDVLVLAKAKASGLQYKSHIVLHKAKVRSLAQANESKEKDWAIEIICPYQGVDSLNSTFIGSPTVHVIRTFNKEEQLKWIRCLEYIIGSLDEQKSQHPNSNMNTSSKNYPYPVQRRNTDKSNETYVSATFSSQSF